MITVGMVDSEYYQQMEQKLCSKTYQLVNVKDKSQLCELEGVILTVTDKYDLMKVIDWLLACQAQPALFVWVISTVLLEEEEEAILLELGANDVLKISGNLFCLTKRIENTFERVRPQKSMCSSLQTGVLFNEKNQSVLVNGYEQPLTRKEFQLVYYLYENKNTVVTYEQLMRYMWPNKEQKEIYRLSNTIFHIRKKVQENDSFILRTVRSIGYMLTVTSE